MTATRPPAADTSVGRALRVVDVVAEMGDGATPKAIARRLGFTLPTTYRLLTMLVEEGYLVRLREPRGYGLGYRMGALARRLADQVAAPWSVQAVLHDMHEAAGAASYYAVIRGGDVVVAHLDACPDHPGDGAPRVGEPAPAHALAAGKVLLAWLDRRRLAEVLATPLPAFTPGTVTDRAMLDRELRRCRELGSAVEVEELRPDRAGMASPVRGPGGAVVGAVALSVSRVELMARWSELERVVRDGAARAGAGLSRPVAVG